MRKTTKMEEGSETAKKGNEVVKKRSVKGLALALVACLALTLTGCGNHDVFDTVYTFDYAIVLSDDGGTIIPIKQWGDYEGEQYQIQTKDGSVFLTSSYDTKLVNTKNSNMTPEDIIISLRGSDAEIRYYEVQEHNLSK